MPADAVLPTLKLWTKAGLLPGLSEESCQLLALPRRAPAGQSSEVHAAQRAWHVTLYSHALHILLPTAFVNKAFCCRLGSIPKTNAQQGLIGSLTPEQRKMVTVLPEVAGNGAPGAPRLLARLPSLLRDRVGLRGRPVSRACCLCFCSLM